MQPLSKASVSNHADQPDLGSAVLSSKRLQTRLSAMYLVLYVLEFPCRCQNIFFFLCAYACRAGTIQSLATQTSSVPQKHPIYSTNPPPALFHHFCTLSLSHTHAQQLAGKGQPTMSLTDANFKATAAARSLQSTRMRDPHAANR